MPNRITIIGGGLAGCLLGFELIKRGHHVVIWDDGAKASASRVAAGLFNVITGRFGAKSWRADELLGSLQDWLNGDNREDFQSFIHYLPIYRPFKTIEEYNKWQGRFTNPSYEHLVEFQEKPYRPEVLNNKFGGIWIKPCGWADVAGLTEWIRKFIQDHKNGSLISEKFDYSMVNPESQTISSSFINERYEHLIFCEGYRAKGNPFFSAIPIIPNKGELLEIYAPDLKLEVALSRKVYLVPLGDDRYVVGSTYANAFDHTDPSEEEKETILEQLAMAANFEFEIIKHKAGVRPTTPDRRPILGSHPHYNNVHIMSGFGTKGMLQGPFFSRCMADYLEDPEKNPIPEEVQLARFF